MSDYFDIPTKKPSVNFITQIDRIIRRHKIIILGIPLIGISTCALYLYNTKPIYESKTQILFHNNDQPHVESQTKVIESETIIKQAIKALKLIELKEKPPESKFKTLNVYSPELEESSESLIDDGLSDLSTHIARRLKATRLPNSYIIQITYADTSPTLASDIVNTITNEYLKSNKLPQNINTAKSDPTDLTALLQTELTHAREELALHKQQIGRITPISFATAISKAKEKEYEQALLKLSESKSALYPFLNDNGDLEFNAKAPAILRSTFLQQLKFKADELGQQQRLLSKRYGHKHPKMVAITSAISLINSQIEREGENIMHRIYGDYKAAKNRIESIEKPDNTENLAEMQDLQQEKLMLLQNRVTSTQALLNAYNRDRNAAPATTQSEQTPPTWISQGFTPRYPTHPNTRKMLGITTLISVILGFALAALFEKLRPTFLSGKEIEEITERPCYALIPQSDTDPLLDTKSQTADAVRALRLALKLRENSKDDNKVVTITSSYPNEGKSTLALWMARLAAKAGERVIIIDADLRRPSLHIMTNNDNTMSIVEYINRQGKMEDIINTTDPSGAHIIYGRKIPNSAIDLLSSERMEQLVRSLRKAYDLIIIDSPACMAAPDAQALAKLSDTLLYAVHWNKTRREAVQSGISQFPKTEKPRCATILTQINLEKHIEFGFGHSFFDYESQKDYAPA
ncbi:MAG: GumC family protein [Alphaproteobacteria bacterium]